VTGLRRARVLRAEGEHSGAAAFTLEILEGSLAGRQVPGLSYRELGPPPEPGETVLANTAGPEMGLGTGGVALILPRDGSELPENRDHFTKLPYTPLQFPARPARMSGTLRGVPVVVLPLHSHLSPACAAAGGLAPGKRVAFVWQEGGALPVAFSETVRVLKAKNLLHAVVSCGNCFGGDLESPNVYAGLLAAAGVADLVLAGIGPGVVGTGAAYGHGGMSAAVALNAATALGATPVLAPRLSHADPRERHRGMSHHTRTVIRAALGGCRVALPQGADGVDLSGLPERHRYERVGFGAGGLEEKFGLTFKSMGRGYGEDPVFFDAAAAAVALALGGESR
jgi:hypothetical protein